MTWILVPCLVTLRAEFNELAPTRDHTSDGSIGDGEHSQTSSDHNPDETGKTPTEDADSTNEVHAIDVDKDLNRTGWSMEKAVGIIVDRHRAGYDTRLQNVIYNRRIWSRSWGWEPRVYTGVNPHDKHAHFSARYATAQESDTRPWGLLEADDMLSDADKEWLASLVGPSTAGVRAALKDDPALISDPVKKLLADNKDLLGDAFREVLWDAVHAKRAEVISPDGTINYVTGGDPVYDTAGDRQREMRNTLQLFRELGMVPRSAPTPQA